ncbi:putative oxalocrotonate tautomerase enzyme-domain-containing protein [Lentinula raphanica]|nr:putative oxalocrotonate tautomerase enzyme-domain-containing protein [Lentinula raphanica]
MPFHRFYCTANLYTKAEKQAIARSITDLYAKVPVPRFYVVINFIEVGEDDYYVSGEPAGRFVRIHVQHLARNLQTFEEKREFMERYEKVLEPFTKGKCIDWEVQVSNEDVSLDTSSERSHYSLCLPFSLYSGIGTVFVPRRSIRKRKRTRTGTISTSRWNGQREVSRRKMVRTEDYTFCVCSVLLFAITMNIGESGSTGNVARAHELEDGEREHQL